MAKIKESQINKAKHTYKKVRKTIILWNFIFFSLILFARQVNANYKYVIEPFLLQQQLLDPSKVKEARDLVKYGYYIIMLISYLPNLFASLKYEDKEQRVKAQMKEIHNIFIPTSKTKKGEKVYKVKKVADKDLEKETKKAIQKEFSKIRTERLKNKTSFTPAEFKGHLKTIAKNNPIIAKYLDKAKDMDDVMDLYYKYKDLLDKYIV